MISKTPAFEFSRPLLVDRVPRKGSHERVVADSNECTSLAKRFAIHALHKVSAMLLATPWHGGGMKVTGTVEAEVELVSVVSLEVFKTRKSFQVERYFMPANKLSETLEVDADPIVDGVIDLGEIVAETVGLELDPYPRLPGETFTEVEKN